jgi:hypothetical protein
MLNFYDKKEVKKHIKKCSNPNFHLHGIEMPFRMLVVAPSGSGKSNFVCNLLKLFCAGNGSFEQITLFCKSRFEPLYEYLAEASKGAIQVTEDLSNLPPINDLDSNTQKLFIFDDLVLENNPLINEYWIRGRKKSVSLIYLTQSFYRCDKLIRQNCRYFTILKISGGRDLQMLLRDVCVEFSKEELLKIYNYATAEKFSVLLIDTESNDRKYRKNFTEYIK